MSTSPFLHQRTTAHVCVQEVTIEVSLLFSVLEDVHMHLSLLDLNLLYKDVWGIKLMICWIVLYNEFWFINIGYISHFCGLFHIVMLDYIAFQVSVLFLYLFWFNIVHHKSVVGSAIIWVLSGLIWITLVFPEQGNFSHLADFLFCSWLLFWQGCHGDGC